VVRCALRAVAVGIASASQRVGRDDEKEESAMLKLKDRILSEIEIHRVLDDLSKRAKRSTASKQNLVVFRLACCCGLSRTEIADLQLRDVHTYDGRPRIEVCKVRPRDGDVPRKPRVVPLHIDKRLVDDITAWRAFRHKQSGGDRLAPFVCGLRKVNAGMPIPAKAIALKWKTAIRCLGTERVKQLSVMCGRHTYCRHLLNKGFDLATVQAFAGHASIQLTAAYLEEDEATGVEFDGNLFKFTFFGDK
jgi:integrase